MNQDPQRLSKYHRHAYWNKFTMQNRGILRIVMKSMHGFVTAAFESMKEMCQTPSKIAICRRVSPVLHSAFRHWWPSMQNPRHSQPGTLRRASTTKTENSCQTLPSTLAQLQLRTARIPIWNPILWQRPRIAQSHSKLPAVCNTWPPTKLQIHSFFFCIVDLVVAYHNSVSVPEVDYQQCDVHLQEKVKVPLAPPPCGCWTSVLCQQIQPWSKV